jgi:uncharacterized protein
MLSKNLIISQTIEMLKLRLDGAEGGHDLWHALRVWKNAQLVAKGLDADMLVVELAALLHDISDAKFNGGNELLGAELAYDFLLGLGLDATTCTQVRSVVENCSYRKTPLVGFVPSIELQIVQDADRLDAMCAIGIGRAFSYGGHKGRAMYDPEIEPVEDPTKEEYAKIQSPTINHFYEKLLLLKDLMATTTAKNIANKRHAFMLNFLNEFYLEWDGKL